MKKLSFILLSFVFIFSAFETVNAADWMVTKSTNSNDGVCDADCSLREAVTVAASGDRVIFNSNLIGQTFTLDGTALSVSGKNLEIDGNLDGVNVAFLSGSDNTFHFNISNNASLSLKNMILAAGRGGQQGSILCVSSNLSLDRVAIRGNRGFNFGAIQFVQADATPHTQVITNSSITGNVADGVGATLFSAISLNQLSTLYMSNTTISNNRSISGGGDPNFIYGALFVGGTAILRNCTITDNQTVGTGGGIYVQGSRTLDIGNTIVAGNTADLNAPDIFVAPASNTISRGGNLIGDNTSVPGGIFNQINDAVNLNPLLAPSNSNQGGHPVFTHPLQAGSPARNTGRNAFAREPFSNLPLTNDARGAGFPRMAGTVDKGAFEDQSNGSTLFVSKKTNSNDGVCDLDCSLREAVTAAANDAGTDTITFAANVFGTLDLGGSEILIQNNDVNIVGYPSLSAETLIVSGNDTNRILRISNSDVSITGMTFANGNGVSTVNSGFGGAIYAQNNSNLTLDRVIVRNNSANFYGALYLLGGTHRIINSTIHTNQANACVAIGNVNSATLNMANVTLSTNFDSDGGTGAGALCNINSTANIRNSTISFNRIGSDPGAGIWSNGTLSIGNTIVSNNIAGSNPDINNASGTINSAGGNLVQDANGLPFSALNGANDQTGVDPMINALSNNGGNVPTHSLMAQSPAINTGLNSNAVDPFDNSALATDARGGGFMRIVSIVDKGAYETLIPTSASVTVSGKVFDGAGKAVSKAKVLMTDMNGITRAATTNTFGNFTFTDVPAGATYIFNVNTKQSQYNPQVISVAEAIADLNFSPQQ